LAHRLLLLRSRRLRLGRKKSRLRRLRPQSMKHLPNNQNFKQELPVVATNVVPNKDTFNINEHLTSL
jgi:hypothetical protein